MPHCCVAYGGSCALAFRPVPFTAVPVAEVPFSAAAKNAAASGFEAGYLSPPVKVDAGFARTTELRRMKAVVEMTVMVRIFHEILESTRAAAVLTLNVLKQAAEIIWVRIESIK